MIGNARRWLVAATATLTGACGSGHIGAPDKPTIGAGGGLGSALEGGGEGGGSSVEPVHPCEGDGDCLTGTVCCDEQCVDKRVDRRACQGCGVECSGTDYCSPAGCAATDVASACTSQFVTIPLDGLPVDDRISQSFAALLASGCDANGNLSPVVVPQDQCSLLDGSGRPLGTGADLFIQIGGPYGQKLLRYLEGAKLTPAYSVYSNDSAAFYGRASGGADPVIAKISPDAGHDLFVIETILDPSRGSRTLALYGLFAPGTVAALWYFEHQVLPDHASYTKGYYVYEWKDADGDGLPGDADTFRLAGSGQ